MQGLVLNTQEGLTEAGGPLIDTYMKFYAISGGPLTDTEVPPNDAEDHLADTGGPLSIAHYPFVWHQLLCALHYNFGDFSKI